MKNLSPQTGFALLYAVLLTGIILAIGLGLSSIMAKQITLSSTGAASQKAYYAAHTLIDCLSHYGIRGKFNSGTNSYESVFGGYVATNDGVEYERGAVDEITCAGQSIDIEEQEGNDSVTFAIDGIGLLFGGSNLCAKGVVVLRSNGDSTIEVTGRSVSCNVTNNLRLVERVIKQSGSFFLSPS